MFDALDGLFLIGFSEDLLKDSKYLFIAVDGELIVALTLVVVSSMGEIFGLCEFDFIHVFGLMRNIIQ